MPLVGQETQLTPAESAPRTRRLYACTHAQQSQIGRDPLILGEIRATVRLPYAYRTFHFRHKACPGRMGASRGGCPGRLRIRRLYIALHIVHSSNPKSMGHNKMAGHVAWPC